MKKKIGVVGVDSGQLIICDPCYVPELPDYDQLCNIEGQLKYALGHAGLGIKIGDFGGDGSFGVYGTYGKDGLLEKIEIDFTRILDK